MNSLIDSNFLQLMLKSIGYLALAFKQLRLAAERATDDAVIAGGCEAKPYAVLLLQFAKEAIAGRRSALASTTPMAQDHSPAGHARRRDTRGGGRLFPSHVCAT